jgi:hypothetical protein
MIPCPQVTGIPLHSHSAPQPTSPAQRGKDALLRERADMRARAMELGRAYQRAADRNAALVRGSRLLMIP